MGQKVQKGFFLTVYIHLAVFGVLYVVLLGHDDVLDVFHRQVVAEGVVQEPLQLFHRQLLHVTLQRHAHNNVSVEATPQGSTVGADKEVKSKLQRNGAV